MATTDQKIIDRVVDILGYYGYIQGAAKIVDDAGTYLGGSDPKIVALASCWAHAVPVMQNLLSDINSVLDAEEGIKYRDALVKARDTIFNEFCA